MSQLNKTVASASSAVENVAAPPGLGSSAATPVSGNGASKSRARSPRFLRRVIRDTLLVSRARLLIRRVNRFLTTRGLWSPFTMNPHGNEASWREAKRADRNASLYLAPDPFGNAIIESVLPSLPLDSHILEVGCGPGRHLDYLRLRGYRSLAGIEISPTYVEMMRRNFPEAYATSRIRIGSLGEEIRQLPSDSVDLVICMGILEQLGPKDHDVFRELSRVCRRYILAVENLGSVTGFHRDLVHVFGRAGCDWVAHRTMRKQRVDLLGGSLSDFDSGTVVAHVFAKRRMTSVGGNLE